jgi:hypothetical protein
MHGPRVPVSAPLGSGAAAVHRDASRPHRPGDVSVTRMCDSPSRAGDKSRLSRKGQESWGVAVVMRNGQLGRRLRTSGTQH